MNKTALKKTRSRDSERMLVLLDMLRSRYDHPDAEKCFEDMQKLIPGIGKSTVYRHLSKLSSTGSILELKTDTGPAKYDGNLEFHGHYKCLLCNKIWDLYPIDVKANPPGSILNQTYFAHGICQACA